MAAPSGKDMTSWPELEPMKNKLVNYGVTENGIAIIELCSDSAGEPLVEGKTQLLPTLEKCGTILMMRY